MVRRFLLRVGSVVFMATLLAGILWVDGFDFDEDGVTWSDLGDHPTNWLDTVAHPDAQTYDHVPVLDW